MASLELGAPTPTMANRIHLYYAEWFTCAQGWIDGGNEANEYIRDNGKSKVIGKVAGEPRAMKASIPWNEQWPGARYSLERWKWETAANCRRAHYVLRRWKTTQHSFNDGHNTYYDDAPSIAIFTKEISLHSISMKLSSGWASRRSISGEWIAFCARKSIRFFFCSGSIDVCVFVFVDHSGAWTTHSHRVDLCVIR